MLILRSILFALLLPGTVTVLVPYFIVSRSGPVALETVCLAMLLNQCEGLGRRSAASSRAASQPRVDLK